MGICDMASYRGASIIEAICLDTAIVELVSKGVV